VRDPRRAVVARVADLDEARGLLGLGPEVELPADLAEHELVAFEPHPEADPPEDGRAVGLCGLRRMFDRRVGYRRPLLLDQLRRGGPVLVKRLWRGRRDGGPEPPVAVLLWVFLVRVVAVSPWVDRPRRAVRHPLDQQLERLAALLGKLGILGEGGRRLERGETGDVDGAVGGGGEGVDRAKDPGAVLVQVAGIRADVAERRLAGVEQVVDDLSRWARRAQRVF